MRGNALVFRLDTAIEWHFGHQAVEGCCCEQQPIPVRQDIAVAFFRRERWRKGDDGLRGRREEKGGKSSSKYGARIEFRL